MNATIAQLVADPKLAAQQAALLQQRLAPKLQPLAGDNWPAFSAQLQATLPSLLGLYLALYGARFDCYFYLEQLLCELAQLSSQRPAYLRQQDLQPQTWHQQHNALGAACYVDLFAGDFAGLRQRIPYLTQTGITYLHLMPLFKAPQPDSDGGYAVSDYRSTDPRLGTMAELSALLAELQQQGIKPVLDFVFNHTSDEHQWAQQAKAGDRHYQDFYFLLTAAERDRFAPHLREIFPQVRRGCFSYHAGTDRWVWTTFNNFQWDLNYANPAVFNAMAGEMLFLANQGVAVLRLDALAFVWKEAGTSCENLPQAHSVIQAFNAVARIAAPSLQFKSEAIVHPAEVVKYIAPVECQLSYNPLLMALLWESLATRRTHLLTASLQQHFAIHPDCSWVNYIRCHDDIGWTFDDQLAWQLGINPHDHRHFLNQFYTGQFAGSFACGEPFGENPQTGDCRVAGMLASLAGLEQALHLQNQLYTDHALARIRLLNSIILSIGGLPLLYLGDELGLLNDYSYREDSGKQHDARWVNRVRCTDADLANATKPATPGGMIYQQLQQLLTCRAGLPILGSGRTEILPVRNPHIFAYRRHSSGSAGPVLCLCNFSEHSQVYPALPAGHWQDALTTGQVLSSTVTLTPYQVLWLTAAP